MKLRARRITGWEVAAVLAAILVAVAFTAIVRSADPQPGKGISPAVVGHTPAVAPGTRGSGGATSAHKLFERDCAWCHGSEGQGTKRAPSLKHAGVGGADFWLRTGRMPLKRPGLVATRGRPAYSSSTIRSLAKYVGGLGHGPAIPTVSAGDPVEGQKLFVANCAACHSSSGTGMAAPGGVQAPSLYPTKPQQVAEAIRLGPGQMPPFGSHQLDGKQLDDVVAYVGQLGDKQVKGGASLAQLGPIAEGMLVLLVPLPLLVLVIRLLGKKAGS